jgi:tRNA-binding EMAP/Myf-like protein
MNSNHKANVVRIFEVTKHPNADSLSLVAIEGYQVVVRTEEFKLGELYLYIQPDSIVPPTPPFKFLWSDKEFVGDIPQKYRRVTVRRFRGEWSEGLLLPLSDFGVKLNPVAYKINGRIVQEGEDIAELLSITHYEEPEPVANIQGKSRQYKTWPPRSVKGFFYWLMHKLGWDLNGPLGGDTEKPPKNTPPVYDVESFKNYPRLFEPGEQVIVTEKVHGSNLRAMFDGKRMWVGSKNLWKSEKSTCIWRRALKELPWIEKWCRFHPGATLYGEIVPTQKGYTYGTNESAPVKVFAFDLRSDPGCVYPRHYFEEDWVSKGSTKALMGEHFIPVLYEGPYDEVKIKALVEGPSTVPGANHIREGIVITSATERSVRGVGRAQLKLKSLKFLEKEGKQ